MSIRLPSPTIVAELQWGELRQGHLALALAHALPGHESVWLILLPSAGSRQYSQSLGGGVKPDLVPLVVSGWTRMERSRARVVSLHLSRRDPHGHKLLDAAHAHVDVVECTHSCQPYTTFTCSTW